MGWLMAEMKNLALEFFPVIANYENSDTHKGPKLFQKIIMTSIFFVYINMSIGKIQKNIKIQN